MESFFLPGAVAVLLGAFAVTAWIFWGKSDSGKLSVGGIGLKRPIGFILIIFRLPSWACRVPWLEKPWIQLHMDHSKVGNLDNLFPLAPNMAGKVMVMKRPKVT